MAETPETTEEVKHPSSKRGRWLIAGFVLLLLIGLAAVFVRTTDSRFLGKWTVAMKMPQGEVTLGAVMSFSRLGTMDQSLNGTPSGAAYQWWVEGDDLVIVGTMASGFSRLRERAIIAWHLLLGKTPPANVIRFRIVAVDRDEITLEAKDQNDMLTRSVLRRVKQ